MFVGYLTASKIMAYVLYLIVVHSGVQTKLLKDADAILDSKYDENGDFTADEIIEFNYLAMSIL